MRKHKLFNATTDDQIKDNIIRGRLLKQSTSNRINIYNCYYHNSPSILSDENQIRLRRFTVDGVSYRFKREMLFPIRKDESGEYYWVYYPEHRLDEMAKSIPDLQKEIEITYHFLWTQYVEADENILTPKAKELARALKEDLEKMS